MILDGLVPSLHLVLIAVAGLSLTGVHALLPRRAVVVARRRGGPGQER